MSASAATFTGPISLLFPLRPELLTLFSAICSPTQRLERYHFRYQTLVNFRFEPATKVIQGHKDAQDSPVDLQLARLMAPEGVSDDSLRVELVRQLMALPEEVGKTNLVLFSGAGWLQGAMNQGKTSLVPGVRGIEVLKGEPRWTDVLARQGLYLIMEEGAAFFAAGQLTDEGKQVLEAINKASLFAYHHQPHGRPDKRDSHRGD